MTIEFERQPSLAFWFIGGAALIWNLFGLIVYIGQVSATPEGLAAANYTPEQIAFIESTPAWVTSAFAISVTAGVLGCVFLLLRKAWALPMFVVSLIAVVIQNIHSFVLENVTAVFGTTPLMIQSAVMLIAIGLVFYARRMRTKGWIS